MGESWVILLAWSAVYGGGEVPPGVECRPGFAQAVRSIAICEELIGDWEQTPTAAEARSLLLACEGLPRTWCLANMPPEAWLDEQLSFAGKHRDWLTEQMAAEVPGSRLWRLEEWASDARVLHQIYSEVSNAHCDLRGRWRPLVSIRERLGRVRDMIGAEALERGELPPVVPLWRFRRVP